MFPGSARLFKGLPRAWNALQRPSKNSKGSSKGFKRLFKEPSKAFKERNKAKQALWKAFKGLSRLFKDLLRPFKGFEPCRDLVTKHHACRQNQASRSSCLRWRSQTRRSRTCLLAFGAQGPRARDPGAPRAHRGPGALSIPSVLGCHLGHPEQVYTTGPSRASRRAFRAS